MMRKLVSLALALVLGLFLGLGVVPSPVEGAPPPPPPPQRHYFHGAVSFDGSPLPGSIVSAHWDSTSKQTTADVSSEYGKAPDEFYIEEGEGGIESGDTITFKVNGVVVTTRNFTPGAVTLLNLDLEGTSYFINGVTGEADCAILGDVTVTLYDRGGTTPIGSVVSTPDGNYALPVFTPGDYDVEASKAGFRNQREEVTIPLGQFFTELNFIGEKGLVPNAPDMAYVLVCVNHWLYPPGDWCDLTMAKVLEVVNAWLYPIV